MLLLLLLRTGCVCVCVKYAICAFNLKHSEQINNNKMAKRAQKIMFRFKIMTHDNNRNCLIKSYEFQIIFLFGEKLLQLINLIAKMFNGNELTNKFMCCMVYYIISFCGLKDSSIGGEIPIKILSAICCIISAKKCFKLINFVCF